MIVARTPSPVLRSNAASSSSAGPRVISRKAGDAGYLLVLTNDSAVMIGADCADHGTGSPQALISRSAMNPASATTPINASRLRRSSPLIRNNGPRQNPNDITATQGING